MKRFVAIGILMLLAIAVLAGGTALAQPPFEARVLVWESTPKNDGQLEFLTSAGASEVVVDLPAGLNGNLIKFCGHDYWAAGGKAVVLFAGYQQGDIRIYPLAGGTPITLGKPTLRMACAGPATFQLSPNSQRAGYIDYVYTVADELFPYGNLLLFDANTGGDPLASFDWTVSFALYDDGALMLRFYPDGKGNATEADLDWWDGSARRTLVTLQPVYPPDKPDVQCTLKAASIVRVGDTAYVLTGQSCDVGGSRWRLVSVPMAGGAATEIASGEPGGGFFSEHFTLNLIPSKDGKGFLVTVPSGLERNTVRLMWVTMDGSITEMLSDRHVRVDRYVATGTANDAELNESRQMLVSPDGSALAFLTVTGSNAQTLWLLDLSTPGTQPVMVQEQGISENVWHYIWSASNRLYYAAGTVETDSLYVVTPGGSPSRIERGRFFRIGTSYTGDKIAVAEWFANPNSLGDDLFQLKLYDTNGNNFILKQGTAEEHNKMIPLAVQ
jgi:hypothetical protein